METTVLRQRVKEFAASVSEDIGLELVDVVFSASGRKTLLRVIVDKEGGVAISDCEKTSRALEALLDVEDLMRGAYVLEVTSPGLDRPLENQRDFNKSIGKLARIVTREKIENQTFFIGRIIDAGEGWIRLKIQKQTRAVKGAGHQGKQDKDSEGTDIFIPLDNIAKARLEIEF